MLKKGLIKPPKGDLIDGKEVRKDEEDIVSRSPRERGCFLG